MRTRERCWPRSSPVGWTSGSGPGSSPSPAATRWPLLELPHGVTAAEWAGGFGVAGPAPLTGRIEQSFQRRIAPPPEATRCLLLLAAAEPTGDPTLLWRAAGRLGISTDAADPAEAERLLTVADRVTFRHPHRPLGRLSGGAAADRRLAHHAIAEATDPGTDPDRRAWHQAQAAPRPDEDIAAELERSASRAQARGGGCGGRRRLSRTICRPDTRSGPARSPRARSRTGEVRRRSGRPCVRATGNRGDGPTR
jgi:hypothetical protein